MDVGRANRKADPMEVPTGDHGGVSPGSRLPGAGFTLVEVLISIVIAALLMGAVVGSYLTAAATGERAVMVSAAQQKAFNLMERVRGARWDIPAGVDEWPESTQEWVETLDLPETVAGPDGCTNRITVSAVGGGAPMRQIRVECIWGLPRRGAFTNELITFRAPNQ